MTVDQLSELPMHTTTKSINSTYLGCLVYRNLVVDVYIVRNCCIYNRLKTASCKHECCRLAMGFPCCVVIRLLGPISVGLCLLCFVLVALLKAEPYFLTYNQFVHVYVPSAKTTNHLEVTTTCYNLTKQEVEVSL